MCACLSGVRLACQVLSARKLECGRAVKKGRERTVMTRVKQLGSKLREASCSTQGEIMNGLEQRYLYLSQRETLNLDPSI